jgi:hypothetical protein
MRALRRSVDKRAGARRFDADGGSQTGGDWKRSSSTEGELRAAAHGTKHGGPMRALQRSVDKRAGAINTAINTRVVVR